MEKQTRCSQVSYVTLVSENQINLLCFPVGSGEEQAAAATLFTLLCVQLGGGDEAEEGFKMLRPILTAILMDNSASIMARQSVSYPIILLQYVKNNSCPVTAFFV